MGRPPSGRVGVKLGVASQATVGSAAFRRNALRALLQAIVDVVTPGLFQAARALISKRSMGNDVLAASAAIPHNFHTKYG
jgi:hypothetical protein